MIDIEALSSLSGISYKTKSVLLSLSLSPPPSSTISNQPPSWNATNKISTIREAKSILYLAVRISQINTFSHRRVLPVSLNIINAIRRHLPVFRFVCVIERIVTLSISNYFLSLSLFISSALLLHENDWIV